MVNGLNRHLGLHPVNSEAWPAASSIVTLNSQRRFLSTDGQSTLRLRGGSDGALEGISNLQKFVFGALTPCKPNGPIDCEKFCPPYFGVNRTSVSESQSGEAESSGIGSLLGTIGSGSKALQESIAVSAQYLSHVPKFVFGAITPCKPNGPIDCEKLCPPYLGFAANDDSDETVTGRIGSFVGSLQSGSLKIQEAVVKRINEMKAKEKLSVLMTNGEDPAGGPAMAIRADTVTR